MWKCLHPPLPRCRLKHPPLPRGKYLFILAQFIPCLARVTRPCGLAPGSCRSVHKIFHQANSYFEFSSELNSKKLPSSCSFYRFSIQLSLIFVSSPPPPPYHHRRFASRLPGPVVFSRVSQDGIQERDSDHCEIVLALFSLIRRTATLVSTDRPLWTVPRALPRKQTRPPCKSFMPELYEPNQ